jgi:hypothetical protein
MSPFIKKGVIHVTLYEFFKTLAISVKVIYNALISFTLKGGNYAEEDHRASTHTHR